MKLTVIITSLLALFLAGCGDIEEPEEEESAAEEEIELEEEEPEPKEPIARAGTYGSDARLDRLQDRCDDDDWDACDKLYMDSPLGSEYEAYALDRLDNAPPLDDIELDEEVEDFIMQHGMQIGWDTLDSEEKAMACNFFNGGNEDFLFESFVAHWDEGVPPTRDQFMTFMRQQC